MGRARVITHVVPRVALVGYGPPQGASIVHLKTFKVSNGQIAEEVPLTLRLARKLVSCVKDVPNVKEFAGFEGASPDGVRLTLVTRTHLAWEITESKWYTIKVRLPQEEPREYKLNPIGMHLKINSELDVEWSLKGKYGTLAYPMPNTNELGDLCTGNIMDGQRPSTEIEEVITDVHNLLFSATYTERRVDVPHSIEFLEWMTDMHGKCRKPTLRMVEEQERALRKKH